MGKTTQDVTLLKRSARDYARIYKPKPEEIPKFARQKFARYDLRNEGMKLIRNEMRRELGYKVSD